MKQNSYTFDSNWRLGENLIGDFTEEDIKKEPQFFSSDGRYAYKQGGPITRSFFDAFFIETIANASVPAPEHDKNIIFDSRVHMLMPGWYPCIPGWHHDDIPRPNNGQPDYDNPEYLSQHVCALVNGDICPTEFILDQVTLPAVEEGKTIYSEWDKALQTMPVVRADAPSNRLIFFDWQTFHRGTKAVKGGWRWFGRLSWNTNRKFKNEIRTQTQVYLEAVNEGW